MNKTFLHILLLFCSCAVFAQVNLVYNGDFELYSDCPFGFSDPTQNPKEIERCIGWKSPTYGTSDYYNACATGTNVAIPINGFGEQNPYSGDGYLGAYFTNYNWGAGYDGYSGIMWWEYVQGQLTALLEQGKVYKFSMEVSLAEGSDLMINEIGVYFSNTPVTSSNTAALTVSPQIVFHNSDYLQDTLNWMHLETLYMASGGEQYLTIGNFRDNITTDTLRRYNLEPIGANPYFTYLYIDDVVLMEEEQAMEIPNIFTPNGDGINDYWSLPFQGEEMKVYIYNRWGNLVYVSASTGLQWDGSTQEGKACSEGTYFYRVSNTNIKGFIQLVR